jgi:hypothetical protein
VTQIHPDLETFLIAPGLQAPPIVAVGFTVDTDPTPEIIHVKDPAFRRFVETLITDPAASSDWHNAAFDLACLCAHDPEWITPIFDAYEANRIVCTVVREKLIRIGRGEEPEKPPKGYYDLAHCLERWNGQTIDKSDPWRLKYGTLIDVPVAEWPTDAIRYLHLDAASQQTVFYAQETAGAEILADQYRQSRAAFWLRLMECWGLTTDPIQARAYKARVEAGLRADEAAILAAGLLRPDRTKDTKKAKARIVRAYEIKGKPHPLTDGGQPSLDFEACEGSSDPVLVSYTNFSQADTLIGKVDRLLHPVIQASYDPLKKTGRTSCRGGALPKPGEAATAHGAQLQNPPQSAECTQCKGSGKIDGVQCPQCLGTKTIPGVRECLVARPGHALISVDYDACEMRTWAQVCLWTVGYSKLAEVLNDPKRCPHVEMGAGLRSIPLAEAYALRGEERKKLRGVAKGPNFGLPGGMGAARLADYCRQNYGVILSEAAAQQACQVWRETWPEAQPYLDWISRLVGPKGSRATIRQFVSGRVRGDVGFCDAANGFFQGLAADIAKDAGWRIAREMYCDRRSPLFGCRSVVFVHDEFIFESPLDRLTDAGNRCAQIMIDTAQRWSPDLRYSASPAAMLRWSKAAGDPVYDGAGNLIPWEWRDQS